MSNLTKNCSPFFYWSNYDWPTKSILNRFEKPSNCPKMNAKLDEEENRLILDFFVPGTKKEDIILEYDAKDKYLIISKEDQEDSGQWICQENKSCGFSRKIGLSSYAIEASEKRPIESSLQDGVLTVKIPLQKENKVKIKWL